MTPTSTYRLQFRDGMDFDRAAAIVPYLQRLGVSHLYASPIFTAVSGSTHGYDVTDHNCIDPVLGGRAGFDRFSAALRQAGIGLILDIVPNHMAASLENGWWRDVVEWGADSSCRDHFDVDWTQKLTLPILGRSYGEVLAAGELSLRADASGGALALRYFDHVLPLHLSTYGMIGSRLNDPVAASVVAWAKSASPGMASAMHDGIRRLLADGNAASRLAGELKRLSGDAGFLDHVHNAQPWRLQHWKDARKHLSYRRFFEVTGLVGVRVEDDRVFDDVHRLILELVRSKRVDGLRVDHVDGLADPKAYLDRLRGEVGQGVYLVVEKILTDGEALPRDWPVSGTTGYEFIASMADLLVDAGKAAALDRAYASAVGTSIDLEAERHSAKRMIARENFETELKVLVQLAGEANADMAANAIEAAIVGLIVAFPVYRTYGDLQGMPEPDRRLLVRVSDDVRSTLEAGERAALDRVMGLLTGDVPSATALEFRTRFQQLTGPVMAKSVEDTLFYRYNRLIALNEVGCDPSMRGGTVEAFHERMAGHARTHPDSLLATATHDTKRGEDARTRLYALSEAPGIWGEAVARWRGMHAAFVTQLADGPAPEPDTEWLLYQALAGMWPGETDTADAEALEGLSGRLRGFVEKALREAKRHTSWTETNQPYEDVVRRYAEHLLSGENRAFLDDFATVLEPFIRAGALASLTQTIIKLTAPGIPDIYQGTERWDLSLVDPDNRREVDFEALASSLDADIALPCAPGSIADGTAKQRLIAKGLNFRTSNPDLFARGDYIALRVTGAKSSHCIAFMRHLDKDFAITIAPRLVLGLCRDNRTWADPSFWADTQVHLPAECSGRDMRHVLTGEHVSGTERLSLPAILDACPVALLTSIPAR